MRRHLPLLFLAAIAGRAVFLPPLPPVETPEFVAALILPSDREARIFRVDFEEGDHPEPKVRYCLTPIVTIDGKVPIQFSQRGVGLLAVDKVQKTNVVVRAYLRGKRLVEVKPGDSAGARQWETVTIEEREATIEQLLGIPPGYAKHDWWETIMRKPRAELDGSAPCEPFLGDTGLMPGHVSANHRASLMFAAAEFDCLSEETRKHTPWLKSAIEAANISCRRLEKKAQQVRRWADE